MWIIIWKNVFDSWSPWPGPRGCFGALSELTLIVRKKLGGYCYHRINHARARLFQPRRSEPILSENVKSTLQIYF